MPNHGDPLIIPDLRHSARAIRAISEKLVRSALMPARPETGQLGELDHLGEFGEPVRASGFRGGERLRGTREHQGTPARRNLEDRSAVVSRRRSDRLRPGSHDDGGEEFRHSQGQFVGIEGDAGRETERPRLAVDEREGGARPHSRVLTTACSERGEKIALGNAFRRREHELVEDPVLGRVHMNTEDVHVQAG